MATNCPKPIEVTVGFVAGANWDLVHLRTSVRAGPQTRLWSLSSVTGNPLKLGICASRPLGLLSTRVSSPAQNSQMHQNPPNPTDEQSLLIQHVTQRPRQMRFSDSFR